MRVLERERNNASITKTTTTTHRFCVMAFLRTAIRCSVFYRKYGLQGGGGGLPGCFWLQKAGKSSAAASSAIVQESAASTAASNPQPQRDPLDITFEDAKAAFKSKTNWELVRAYIVYTLCSFEYLVDNNMKVSIDFFSLRLYNFAVGWFTGRRRQLRRRRHSTCDVIKLSGERTHTVGKIRCGRYEFSYYVISSERMLLQAYAVLIGHKRNAVRYGRNAEKNLPIVLPTTTKAVCHDTRY